MNLNEGNHLQNLPRMGRPRIDEADERSYKEGDWRDEMILSDIAARIAPRELTT